MDPNPNVNQLEENHDQIEEEHSDKMQIPKMEQIKQNSSTSRNAVDVLFGIAVLITLFGICFHLFYPSFLLSSSNIVDIDFIDIPNTCKYDGLLLQNDFLNLRSHYFDLIKKYSSRSQNNLTALKEELNEAAKAFMKQRKLRETCYYTNPKELEIMISHSNLAKTEQEIKQMKGEITNFFKEIKSDIGSLFIQMNNESQKVNNYIKQLNYEVLGLKNQSIQTQKDLKEINVAFYDQRKESETLSETLEFCKNIKCREIEEVKYYENQVYWEIRNKYGSQSMVYLGHKSINEFLEKMKLCC